MASKYWGRLELTYRRGCLQARVVHVGRGMRHLWGLVACFLGTPLLEKYPGHIGMQHINANGRVSLLEYGFASENLKPHVPPGHAESTAEATPGRVGGRPQGKERTGNGSPEVDVNIKDC